MLKTYTKNGFFFFISLILFPIIKSIITQKEINRICEIGDFSSYSRKTDYSTLTQYFDDQIISNSTSKEYFISFLTTGSYTKKIDKLIKYLIPTIIMFGLALITFITYLIFLCLWSKNSCLFHDFKNKDRIRRQTHCKYCGCLTTFFLLLISIVLCIIPILLIIKLRKISNALLCSLYQFTEHSLNGLTVKEENNTYPIFSGYYTMVELLTDTSNSISSLINSFPSLFPKYSDIISSDEEIIDKIQYLSDTNTAKEIDSPHPYQQESKLTLTYQTLYGPYTNLITMLGEFYLNYTENIHLCVHYLKNIYTDLNNINNYKNSIKNDITDSNNKIELMDDLYNIIFNIINKNYGKIKDSISIFLRLLSFIILGLIIFESFIMIILLTCFVCNKEPTSCNYYCRIGFIIFWNFLFILITLLFLLSGIIYYFYTVNRGIVPTLNYMYSEEYMGDQSNKNNIFLESITKNTNLPKYFQNCLNSEDKTSSNIAYNFNFQTTNLNYINSLYKDYTNFYLYYSNIETDKKNLEKLKENNEILTKYIEDMSLSTTSRLHGEKDVSNVIKLLNQYTDVTYEGSKQIQCVTQTNDRWVTNKNNCPSEYTYINNENIYSEGGFYCLVINEWSESEFNSRYQSACKTYDNQNTGDVSYPYFFFLKKFYNDNKNYLNFLINGNNDLYNIFSQLISNLKIEFQSDDVILQDFLKGYIKYNGLEDLSSSMFDMFDCSILRYDLIDFYDLAKNHFEKKIVIIIICITFSGILLYISQYFGIRLTYIFNKNYKIKEEEDEAAAEISESNNDDEIETAIKNDKDKIKKNFEKEKLNTKNSDGVLLLTQNWNDPNKTYDLNKIPNEKTLGNENDINNDNDNNFNEISESENEISSKSEVLNYENNNYENLNLMNSINGKNNNYNSFSDRNENFQNNNLVNNGNIRNKYSSDPSLNLKNSMKKKSSLILENNDEEENEDDD